MTKAWACGVHEAAEEFGEAQVVAGRQADGEAGQRDGDEFVARTHHHRLPLVEAEAVDLAVGADQFTGGGEDEGGVVEGAVRGLLDDGARVQPHARVARRLRHHLVRRAGDRLRLLGEGLVGEGADGPQFRQDHQIGVLLFAYQRSGPRPTRIDCFVRVYCDLDERGAHTTTVLAFEPSTRAYDRHTKALPGCRPAA